MMTAKIIGVVLGILAVEFIPELQRNGASRPGERANLLVKTHEHKNISQWLSQVLTFD